MIEVLVRYNNVDAALRMLKKKMQREGIFREVRVRRFFETSAEEKKRKRQESLRRIHKLSRRTHP